MKKVIYLISILFAVTLMSTSCEKDPVVPDLTLVEQYPDWKNLSWVSTDGVTVQMNPNVYPRLQITIVGDVGEITHTTIITPHWDSFTKININGNKITFTHPIGSTTGTFSKNGNKITITTKGLITSSHTYELQIN